MYTYIKKSIPNVYIELEDLMSPELYHNLGNNSYNDYLLDKWILLTDTQVEFHKQHPEASEKEVIFMTLQDKPQLPERTLEDAKQEMIRKIDSYDSSSNINQFIINDSIPAWFTVEERSNYKNSIDSAKVLNIEELSFFVGDTVLSIDTDLAEKMLATIQMYADTCFIVTKQHKLKVNSLSTIEEVDQYDYTTGYPDKLNFKL